MFHDHAEPSQDPTLKGDEPVGHTFTKGKDLAHSLRRGRVCFWEGEVAERGIFMDVFKWVRNRVSDPGAKLFQDFEEPPTSMLDCQVMGFTLRSPRVFLDCPGKNAPGFEEFW